MVRALEKVNGVGLARPLAQEPRLAKDILRGSVEGAIKQRPDESGYGLTDLIAGSQLGWVGKGQEPIDMSQEDNETAFQSTLDAWLREAMNETQMLM